MAGVVVWLWLLSYGGRGSLRLRVRFDGDDQPVTIRPHLVRVVGP